MCKCVTREWQRNTYNKNIMHTNTTFVSLTTLRPYPPTLRIVLLLLNYYVQIIGIMLFTAISTAVVIIIVIIVVVVNIISILKFNAQFSSFGLIPPQLTTSTTPIHIETN